MKKIMFNDKYGLTEAVLKGRKTMTRRVITEKAAEWERFKHGDNTIDWDSPYQIIEKIAIAQSYASLGKPVYGKQYNNKMFVSAYDMPHHIEMLNYHVERLQDISDEDCLKEGIIETENGFKYSETSPLYRTALGAYAALIDKVSGKGTWDSNPLVWVYEFKLID